MRHNAVINGLIMGLTLMACSYILQLVAPKIYITYGNYLLLVVVIGIMVKTGSDAKFFNDGFLSLGEAVKNIFIASAIGIAMCTIFEYLLYNFINPDLVDIAIETAKEVAQKAMSTIANLTGEELPQDEINEAMSQIKAEHIIPTPFRSLAAYFLRLIVPGIFGSFIIGLIVKNTKA